MPIYTYKCLSCAATGDLIISMDDSDVVQICPYCTSDMKRIPSRFSTSTPFDSHFNPTVNAHVSSKSQFTDLLKAQSEAATLRTGIEHNYKAIDPRESKDMLGVTDEGLDATRRRAHDSAARHDVTVTDSDRRHPRAWGPLDLDPDALITHSEDAWL